MYQNVKIRYFEPLFLNKQESHFHIFFILHKYPDFFSIVSRITMFKVDIYNHLFLSHATI